MDFGDFRNLVINAVQTINDPQSSSVDRLQAHQTLQNLEQNVSSLFPSIIQLLDKENQFILRQFGLHLLENLIKFFEDVIFLQNVEPICRRRDIHNYLIENIEPYFDRACDLLTQSLRFAAASICNSLCKNDSILKSKAFETLPRRLTEAYPAVIRLLGFPSKNEPPHSNYSQLDFDVDISFLNEFCRFREALTSSLRKILKFDSSYAFKMVSQFIYKLPPVYSKISAVEWDAWIRFITVVIFSVTKSDDFNSTAIKEDSRRMLGIVLDMCTTCLNDDNADFLLSLLSTLFPFLHHHPDFVVKIVERIFTLSLWPNPDTSETSRKIRHHAMHEFVHLAIEQTSSLLPFADAILEEMNRRSNELTLRQKCSLAEGFVVLGNKFTDFEQKKQLLDYLTGPSIAYFTSEDFVSYIALDSGSCYHVDWRIEPAQHIKGKVNNRHPAFEGLKPALSQIFSLARCLNGLYDPKCVKTFDSSFKGYAVLDLIDVEKNLNPSSTIISSQYRDDELRAFDHIKSFVADATEKTYTLVGLIASKCSRQFYNLPEANVYLSRDVLSSIENILDQRLRFCIRRCFIPIVSSIKTENIGKIIPTLNILINHTNSRLFERWQTIKTRLTNENRIPDNEDFSRQEIFLQDSTSTVTRDYLNFLKFALASNTSSTKTNETAKTEIDVDENDADSGEFENLDDESIEMVDSGSGSSSKGNKQSQGEKIFSLILKISPLGVEMLDPKNGFVGSLTLSIFNALTWPDTQSSLKAVELAALVFQHFFAAKMLDDPTVEYMFGCALTALQVHGEHEMWLGRFLTFVCYLHEILRKNFPCIRRVMLELPGVDIKKLEFYENKLNEAELMNIPLALKFRKDVFKRLMSRIIGKNLGQKFKNKVSYSLDIPIFGGEARGKTEPENDNNVESICNLFAG
uniref:Exportin-5 C-terminal domain-containing protein n=1 Tax=Romanomermis culicivorax TaxID=13658 RepID=A0A915KBH0_ROMCU